MSSDLPSITVEYVEEPSYVVEETRASLSTSNPDVQALWQEVYPTSPSQAMPEADKFPYQQGLASGQMSPLHIPVLGLKDPAAGDLFFPLDQTQLQSPSDWSPISSASGELFPESCSDWSSSAPPSHPSSPSLSPSLSPLQSSFGNFGLGDVPDDSDFYSLGAPVLQRPRSSSFTEGRPSTPNSFTDGRPRSASFNVAPLPRLETSFDPIPAEPQPPPFNYHTYDGRFGENDTLLSPVPSPVEQDESRLCPVTGFQLSYPANDTMPPSPGHRRSSSLGGEVATSPTYLAPPTNQQFLTVPAAQNLQRRNAHHRRNHTHTGINAGMGRGRSLEPRRTTSREQSLGHPGIQVDTSSFGIFSTSPTSSPNSPMSSASSSFSYSPVSPASTSSVYSYDDPYASSSIPDINVFSADDPAITRRHSFSGSSVSDNEDYHSDDLHRSRSAPYPTNSHRIPRISRRGALTSQSTVFRAEGMDNSFIDPESVGGSQSELNLHSPGTSSSTEGEFKRTVASHKIVTASEKRRKHAARFECSICDQKFTARHNLNNHLNSHQGLKAYSCRYCGQKATTQAVCTRHEMHACKKNPQKKRK